MSRAVLGWCPADPGMAGIPGTVPAVLGRRTQGGRRRYWHWLAGTGRQRRSGQPLCGSKGGETCA